jgi:hypothetical protein
MAALIALLWETKRYHVVMFQEKPMPGPYDPEQSFIRFKSTGHHTTGAETFEEAQAHLKEIEENPRFTGGEGWIIRDTVLPMIDPVSVILSPTDKFTVDGMISPEEAEKLRSAEAVEDFELTRGIDMEGIEG